MRLIDADAIEPHEQIEPLGNGQYEYVRVAYMDDIDELPTIDPQPQWIPYSEKMPGIGMNAIFTFLTGGYKFVGEGCRRYDDSVWLYRADSMAPKENVLAWMPLPECYKGDEE